MPKYGRYAKKNLTKSNFNFAYAEYKFRLIYILIYVKNKHNNNLLCNGYN